MNSSPDNPGRHRMTRQRRIILDMLAASEVHPTADEVYRVVCRRLPRISLATVYRNLDLLAGEGLIERFHFADGPAYFDAHPGPHHHVRCVGCGQVADVPADFCRIRPGELDRSTGYQLVSCQVEIAGLCPTCRTNRRGDAETRGRGEGEERRGEGEKTGTVTRRHGEQNRQA